MKRYFWTCDDIFNKPCIYRLLFSFGHCFLWNLIPKIINVHRMFLTFFPNIVVIINTCRTFYFCSVNSLWAINFYLKNTDRKIFTFIIYQICLSYPRNKPIKHVKTPCIHNRILCYLEILGSTVLIFFIEVSMKRSWAVSLYKCVYISISSLQRAEKAFKVS